MAYHPFRRLGLKAFSVTLAVVLWLMVSGDRMVERNLRVPLEYQNVPDGIELVGAPQASVDVRLRGGSSMLGRLGPGDVVVVLDLRGARPGTRLFHLLADHVRAPFGVEATNVSPSTVPLQFERNAVRRVEVKPALSGMPAEGYVVSTVRTEPSSVEVVGPESHLSRLTSATTDLVSVDDVRAGFHEEVTIGVVDTAVRLRRPQRATVIVDVARAESGRVVEGVPIDVRNLATPAFADLEVDRATATVEGGNEVVGRLRAADLRVWIDLANLGPGRHAVPVQFEGNTGYGVTRVEPAVVDVTIR